MVWQSDVLGSLTSLLVVQTLRDTQARLSEWLRPLYLVGRCPGFFPEVMPYPTTRFYLFKIGTQTVMKMEYLGVKYHDSVHFCHHYFQYISQSQSSVEVLRPMTLYLTIIVIP